MSKHRSLPPASNEPSPSEVLFPANSPALPHQAPNLLAHAESASRAWAVLTSPQWEAHRQITGNPGTRSVSTAVQRRLSTWPRDCREVSTTNSGLPFSPRWGYVDTPVPVTGDTKQVFPFASQLKPCPTSRKGRALFWWPMLPGWACRASSITRATATVDSRQWVDSSQPPGSSLSVSSILPYVS